MAEILEWVRTGISFLALLFSFCTFLFFQHDRRNRATVKSIDDLSKSVNDRFSEKYNRLNKIEIEVARLPTRTEYDQSQAKRAAEIERIHERIDEINEGIKASQLLIGQLIGKLNGLNHEKH